MAASGMDQFGEGTAAVDELVEAAGLDYATLVEHEDPARLAKCGNRCATRITVRSARAALMAGWTWRSLMLSSAEVPSSRIRIGGFLRKIRARASRCRWPPERFWPRSETSAIVLAGHLHDLGVKASFPRGLFDLGTRHALKSVGNVLGDRPGEDERVLPDALYGEGTLHYGAPSPHRVQAAVHLALSGARLTNAVGGADAQLDAQLDGDPTGPIDVTAGTFAFGPYRGRTTGGVTFGPTFVRADLMFKTGSVHCATGGDVALGGGLQVDTRNLSDARIVVTPTGRCGLRILPL